MVYYSNNKIKKMKYFSLFCFFIFNSISAQGFIEKLITEESNVNVIEERANEYLKKVKSDKVNKLFQRWLYFAKIDADEKGGVISNRNYVNALHQYNYKTNFKAPQPSQQTISWTNLGPEYYNISNYILIVLLDVLDCMDNVNQCHHLAANLQKFHLNQRQ